MIAKMLDSAKERPRNDSQERNRVEETKPTTQMNMAPSEQQSMEMAASALAMEALYKDRSAGGKWQGGMNTRRWRRQ
jgi:hypothetical protein